MRWDARMLELLIRARAAGEHDFSRAWRVCLEVCRREGIKRPRDFVGESPAQREGDVGWQPFSTFFHDACRAEWYGLVRADYLGLPELLADSGLTGSTERGAESQNARVQLLA